MPPREDSKASAKPAGRDPKKLLGRAEPRLFTEPQRPLTRRTTRGFEVIEFANLIGEPLLPWQEWLVKHALELNPDGSYRYRTVLVLVARQNGKSSVKRIVSLWRMYVDGAKTILGTAQDVALAREQMNLTKAMIHASAELRAEWGGERNVNGDEMFWLGSGLPREALPRYMIRATNRKAGRGLSIDELNIDELREQRDWSAWSALSKTTMARPNAQIWCMSNAGDDDSVVLNQLRDAALSGRDPSIFLGEWSAPDGCDLDDWAGIAQSNPGLNHIITPQAITSAMGTDPPEVYRTEVLCQRVDTLDSAIDAAAWRDCADPAGTLDGLRDRVALCVDVSPDGEHVTLAAAAPTSDQRIRVEIVAAWTGTDEARDQLDDWLGRVKPQAVAWFPSGPGGAFASILRPTDLEAKDGRKTSRSNRGREYCELTGGRVTEACQEFADLVKARRILHPGDPLLDNHVHGARRYESGDGWRFVRKGAGHVDAAYAAAGAVQTALTMPVQARPRIRMVS